MQHLVDTAITLVMVLSRAVFTALLQAAYRMILRRKTSILPQLYYKDTQLSRYLVENCSGLSRVFTPPWWLACGHAQTIAPTLLPKTPMAYSREVVPLEDGGQLALDWAVPDDMDALTSESTVCIIMPGLAGDAMGYTHLAKCIFEKGFRAVVFNKRGHGNCPLTTPKLQSFGDPTDFCYVVNYIQEKYPQAKVTAIGISAGSGLLASYLGEMKSDTPLVAGVGISPGYDAEQLFKHHLRPPYDYLLMRGLRGIIQQHQAVLGRKFDMQHVLAARSVAEIEERLYCKIYGHKTVEEYWKHNNPMRDITQVSIPMLCISARDDPVCPEPLIPFSIFKAHDNVILAALDKGGHCGFVQEGSLHNWADRVAVDYLATVIGYLHIAR